MPIPMPIQSKKTIPRAFLRAHLERLEDICPEPEETGNKKDILNLIDGLISAQRKQRAVKTESKFCDEGLVSKKVIQLNLDGIETCVSDLRHIIPRTISDHDQGIIQMALLLGINAQDLEKIISQVPDVGIEHLDGERKGVLFLENGRQRMVIGGYFFGNEEDDTLYFSLMTTHLYNKNNGCLSIKNYTNLLELCGSQTAFNEFFGSWRTITSLPRKSREIIKAIEQYILDRLPTKLFYSLLIPDLKFRGITFSKADDSVSLLSLADMLLAAEKNPKPCQKYFTSYKIDGSISYVVFEASLWDVAVSASRVRYFSAQNNFSGNSYISFDLLRRVNPKSLQEIASNIPGVVLKKDSMNNYSFHYLTPDGKEQLLGRYIKGNYPPEDDEELINDRIEIRLGASHYHNKDHGYLTAEDFQQVLQKCNSRKIFDRLFGSEWNPIIHIPKTSRQIIQAIDQYIKERTFKWLEKYNQGAAATGVITLVRNR